MENTPLDVTFTDDVRISVSVVLPPAAAAAAASKTSKAGKSAKAAAAAEASASTLQYTVHLTGNIDESYQMVTGGGSDGEESEESESDEYGSDTVSEDDDNEGDTQSDDDASSESWGSGDEMDLDDDEDGMMAVASGDHGIIAGSGKRTAANGDDDDSSVAARRKAAETGITTGRWTVPDVYDEATMSYWEAREGAANSEWAYHIQKSGARQHRRSSQMPTFKWTGELRPALVSPRRRVPSVGWLAPPPDYARSGWPEAEFASPLQHRLEVKTLEQLAKMKAACSLGRAVMDAVAAAIKPVRALRAFFAF